MRECEPRPKSNRNLGERQHRRLRLEQVGRSECRWGVCQGGGLGRWVMSQIDPASPGSQNAFSRRLFIGTGLSLAAAIACENQKSATRPGVGGGRTEAAPVPLAGGAPSGQGKQALVTLVEFADSGKKKGKAMV